MVKETPHIKKFNQLLHYKSRKVVKHILEEYIHTSYRSKDWTDEKWKNARVLTYEVVYEHYWQKFNTDNNICCNYDHDTKRQMIYVNIEYTNNTTDTLRLSARNVKKYIRNNYNIQTFLNNQ